MSNSKKILDIACAVDDSFAYPVAVMILSLLDNNKSNNIKIHLFSASLSEKYTNAIEEIVKRYNQDFQFYKLEKEVFEGLPIKDRITVAAYYRVLIPENIEESVEKYLYIDADTIVLRDLKDIFEVDLGNYVIGAINDVSAIDMNKHKKHGISEDLLYFNSGVLLVDKTNWLNSDARSRIIKYRIDNHAICDFLDQDGFNGALNRERLALPPKWNQQIGLFYIEKSISLKAYKNDADINEAMQNPVIVHFNGREKPWNQVSKHPFQKQFNKYAKCVESINYSEKFDLKKWLKKHLLYGIVGWSKVNRYYYFKTKQ
ncbi:MAG TPA: glycosyltransferase family 8 protein [Bacteroidales bacterium]|nr:glycosyltransferase family 8 protein [Bacteroidales bacterium]